MHHPFGPWATLISAGQNPQLSAFWRRRMNRLPAAASSNPALTRTTTWALIAAAILVGIVPTFRGQAASAETEDRPTKAADAPAASGNPIANASDFQKGVSTSFSALVPVVFADVRFSETPREKRKPEEEEEMRRQYTAAMHAFRDQVHAHWPYSGEEYRKQQQAYADDENEINSLFSRAKGGEQPPIGRDEALRRMRQIATGFPNSPLNDQASDHSAYLYFDVKPRRMDDGFRLEELVANSTGPLNAFRIGAMTNLASRPRDADERLRTRQQFAAKMRQWHDPAVLAPLLLNPLPAETEDRYVKRVEGALINIESQYLLNATNMKFDAAIAARVKAAGATKRAPPDDKSKPDGAGALPAAASKAKTAAELLRDFEGVKWSWQRPEIIKKLIAKGDKSVVPEFARMLVSEDRHLRCDAGWVLAGLGDERGLPAVIAELTDTSDRPTERITSNMRRYVAGQIRDDHWYAAWVLEKIHDPRAVSALIKALDDPDVSMEAAIALAHNGDQRAASALLAALERAKADGQPRGQTDMRFWAAYGLLGLRDPQGTKIMVGFLTGDTHVAYQLPANAATQLRQLYTEGNVLMRRYAADAFIEFPDKAAFSALVRATSDTDVEVRVNAITALGRIGDAAAVPTLRALMTDRGTEQGRVRVSYDPPRFEAMTVHEAAEKAIEEINRKRNKADK